MVDKRILKIANRLDDIYNLIDSIMVYENENTYEYIYSQFNLLIDEIANTRDDMVAKYE